ncbi:MAG: endolytic transglycosylase MltG [Oscillospiraceae bacterium]|nr:endolytic transglycosylase MltG [Oscillospiraceae bacterium]
MSEKNEQDIFKNLIDGIQIEEEPEPAGEKPAPGQATGVPKKEEVEIPPQDPQVVPVRRSDEDEELPRWLTEKKSPAVPGSASALSPKSGQSRLAGQDGRANAAVSAERVRPAAKGAAQPTAGTPKGPEAKKEFQVDIASQEEDRLPPLQEGKDGQPPAVKPAISTSEKGPKKKKKVKKQYRVGRALLLTLLFLGLSVYLAFFAIHAFEDLTAVNLFGGDRTSVEQMTVEIPEGASVGQIARILKESGTITEPLAFRLYVMLKQEDGFQSGEYILTDQMDYDSIIYALQAGTERTDVVEIMFPEGSTSTDIAQKLEENGVCSASDFLTALNGSAYNYTFVENIPQNALRFYKLEGYLFPNTHQFFVGESANSVVNRFLKDFNSQITDAMRTRMNELNLTLDQTLALASIIQKEASDPDEMKNVSEVYHNRLNNSDAYPNLQSDPTIYYVERVIKKKIGIANQQMYDAYNTYVCAGLPVGPICNPGLDAIEAALYPAQHEQTYYYFVTDDAGTYYYAQTLSEHEANIAQADKVNKEVAASSAAS